MKVKSVSFKLNSFIIIILAVILLVFQVSVTIVNDAMNRLLEHEVKAASLAQEIDVLTLECRRNEKDFLMRSDESYLEKHAANFAHLQEQIAELSEIAKQTNDETLRNQTASLGKLLLDYRNYFVGIAEKKIAMGLDEESGLRGVLRGEVHGIEDVVNKTGLVELKATMLMCRRHEKDYLLRRNVKYLERFQKEIATLKSQAQLAGMDSDVKGSILSAADRYQAGFEKLVSLDGEISEDTEHMRDAVHEVDPIVSEIHDTRLAASNERAAGTVGFANMVSLVLLVVGASAAIASPFIIKRLVIKPITRASGNLGSIAEYIADASGQMNISSQRVANGASEQATSLEEISSSLEEMTAMTQQNASSTSEARALANDSLSSATASSDAMRQMNEAIEKIKNSSDETAKILKTIDEIAFQTNLLALNAAVEAARAGEAGKGFAVVAEEVRNLAQRSAEAARSTSDLVTDAQANADNGVQVSNTVANSIESMTEATQKISRIIAEIDEASKEQSTGIAQISETILQVDSVINANASDAEQSAASSEQLSGQSAELRSTVQTLLTILHGSRNGHRQIEASATPEGHYLQNNTEEPGVRLIES